jgi:hypothetical protein
MQCAEAQFNLLKTQPLQKKREFKLRPRQALPTPSINAACAATTQFDPVARCR